MAIETAKDSLVLNQIVDQKTDTILIEEDCIVPDSKPDIPSLPLNEQFF